MYAATGGKVIGPNKGPAPCRDIVPLVLFLANVIFIFVFAFMYNGKVELPSITDNNNFTSAEVIELGFLSAGLAFGGGLGIVVVWLVLLFVNAYCMIIFGQLSMAVLLVASGIVFVQQALAGITVMLSWILAILCFFGAAFTILWIWCIRDRIEFTALLLKTIAVDLAKMPELILISMCAACLSYGFLLVWYCAALEFNDTVLKQGESVQMDSSVSPGVYAANAWLLLILFWAELVIVNVSFVTTCGAVGEAYFSGHESVEARGTLCCRPAAWSALRRAVTTSLGSIAFGSLLVAIIQTLKAMARSAQRDSRNGLVALVMCCVVCLLDCIERLLRWLTEWAYVYVALYGTGLIESGSKVMEMLSKSGIDAIITTVLVDPVLRMAIFAGLGAGIGLGCAAVNISGTELYWFACVLGAIVGAVVVAVGLAPVHAGTKALFVCIAEEPLLLQAKAPELSAKVREMMPMGKP